MKQVDKYFKDRLHQHESKVPNDMWDRIAPALEEKSDKVRPIFWLLSSVGIMLVLGLLAIFLSGEAAADQSSQLISEVSPISSLAETINKTTESLAATTTATKSTTAVFNNDLASIDEARNILANSQTEANIASTPIASSTIIPQAIPSIRKSNNKTPQLTDTEQGIKEFKLVITESHFAGREKISNENTKITLSTETKRYLQSVKGLTLPDTKIETEESAIGGIKLFGAKAPQCPSFLEKRVGFFVDGYLSHDFALKSYTGDEAYGNLRRQTESSLYSYGAGVRFSYFLGKGWGIRSGLNYSQVNQRFAYDDPNSKTTKTVIEEVVETNPITGDTISRELIETIVEVPGRHTITHTNKYHFIDIPVLLFYEFDLGDSPFYFTANAGTYINLMFEQSGKYLSPEANPIEIRGDDEYPNPYNSTAGVSLFASFGIHYVLNNSMDLIIEPHLLTQLNSMTRSETDLQERFTTIGLNTGIRYKF